LGDDAIGAMIVADLAAEGVGTGLVQRTAGARSSFSSVYVDARGERQIMNFRGEGLTENTGWIATAPRAAAVLADTRWSAGAARALDLAREWGVPGIVDAEAPMDAEVLDRASHVAFSRDGLMSFVGAKDLTAALMEAAARLPGWVCVTDGAMGTYHVEQGAVAQVAAFDVEVRDTLGAGDIWHGAFALALAEGQGEARAVRFANAAAALKCTTFGGRKGCPYRAAVEEFMKERV
jgi:sulfofructose kinase